MKEINSSELEHTEREVSNFGWCITQGMRVAKSQVLGLFNTSNLCDLLETDNGLSWYLPACSKADKQAPTMSLFMASTH